MSPDSNVYAAPNVLVVNDALDTLELIVFSLKREGYVVLTAANGREAFEIAQVAPLDVVVSDVVMPEMDGVELCRRLRENPLTAQIPILLFSAERLSEFDSLEGLRAGADDYLEIPFRQPELLVKVARLIERRRLKRYYRQIVELSPNIIYTLDANRRLVGINDAGLRFFGRAPAELRGQPEDDLLAPHVLSADADASGEQFADDSIIVLDVKNAAGENRTIELRRKSFHDDIGNLTGFHCIIQDSTERFVFERALRDSEQRYRTLYEDSPLMYFVLDENGTVKSLNRTAVEKLGYAEEELIGKLVFDVFFPEDRPRVLKQIGLLKNSASGVAQWKFRKVHKNGDIVYVSENVRMLPQATGGSIFLVICEDITERVAAEQKTQDVIARLNATVEREELINRITAHVRESLQLETVFQAAVNELGARLRVDRAVLYINNEKNRIAEPQATYVRSGVDNAPLDSTPIALQRIEPFFEKFRRDGLITFDEVTARSFSSEFYENLLKPRSVHSLMCAAIYINEKLIGFIAFSMHEKTRRWSETDFTLARAVAGQIGIAIRQAQLFAHAEAASRREALINRLSIAIRGSLRLSEVHQTATHELGKALDASRVYLRLYNPAQHDQGAAAEFVYTRPGFAGEPVPVAKYSEPLGAAILRNPRPIIINNTAEGAHESDSVNEFVRARINARGVQSAVYCPILVDKKYRGTLCIEQDDRQRDWTESDAALIESVAVQLALGASQAELFEAVRRTKREWETTFDAMGDGVFIFDPKGKLVRVNRAGAAMEQSTVQQLVGKSCCDLLIAEDGDDKCVIQKVIETRRKYKSEQQSKLLKRPLLITDEPIIDETGALVGVVCTVRDLFELRAAEAVARERQSLLTGILEGVLEPIFAVDANGKLLWCNRATAEIYGIEPADITSRGFLEMVHPAERDLGEAALCASLKKLPQFYESRFLNSAGEVRHAVFNSVPLVIENELTSVLWFVRDITKQKHAVQQALQAEKLRALGQLASGVAHDFNNGLAAILGRVSILQRQVTDDNVLRNLKIIKTAAEDAATTVRRVQTFAKQSAQPEFAALELAALVRDSIELTRPRWENAARVKGIEYTVEFDACDSFHVRGNASELREVFVNLIVNALDAMPKGGKLEIGCERRADQIELKFADDGDGIQEDLRERIFEPFFSTKGVNGTGLGLSVSYGIVEQHNGNISVESEIGRGTVFAVTLPATDVHQKQAVTVMLQQAKKDLSVLVVDDEQLVREALMEMIGEFASTVVGADSAKRALSELDARRFDVVFTDFSMPEMDGLDLAARIHENWSEVKTILVTGYGKGVTIPPEKRRNLYAVIGKPFNFEQLSQTFEEISV